MQNRSAAAFAAAALATAITGIAWAAPHVGPLAVTTCNGTAACLSANNAGTGPALLGAAGAGTGVRGVTSGTNAASAGIYGYASSGGTGVAGLSKAGPGLRGSSSASSGAFARSAGANPALSGSATAAATGTGVEGIAAKGTGIASRGLQAFAGIGQFTARAATGDLLVLIGSSGSTAFSVDQAGDVYFASFSPVACLAGYLKSWGTCAAESAPAANGAPLARTAASGRWTTRVVRTGRALLIDGSARVALDPELARALAHGRPYQVFLTDAGSSPSWLYVAAKSPAGFAVREHGGGRSTGAFGYRIVADVVPAPLSASEGPL